jgi:hypothetical protein
MFEKLPLLEDLGQIYEWLWGPTRKIQELMKPGQKLTSEEQEKRLQDKLKGIVEADNKRVLEILRARGLFEREC